MPLFPLRTVLFPGAVLPIRIFEKRYKRMLAHCTETGEGFVAALIRAGAEAGGPSEPFDAGCVADILHIDYRGEQVLLTTVGTERVRLRGVSFEGDYPTAMASALEPLERPDDEADSLYDVLRDRFAYYSGLLARAARVSGPGKGFWQVDDPLGGPGDSDPAEGAFVIADGLQVEPQRKQVLLEAADLRTLILATQDILDGEIDRLEDLSRRFN